MSQDSPLQPFEIEASGFIGDGTTEERLLWVSAPSLEDVQRAVEGLDAKVVPLSDFDLSQIAQDIDFQLPQGFVSLRSALAQYQETAQA